MMKLQLIARTLNIRASFDESLPHNAQGKIMLLPWLSPITISTKDIRPTAIPISGIGIYKVYNFASAVFL